MDQGVTYQFTLEDMHCASCVSAIETALIKLPGVERAEVNFASKIASVNVSETHQLAANDIIKAIKDLGYKAVLNVKDNVPIEHNHAQHEAIQHRKLLHKTIVAFLVGIPTAFMNLIDLPPLTTAPGRIIGILLGAIALFALIYSGGHFFVNTFKGLKRRSVNMDTLIALGTGIAWLYSAFVVLFAQSVPELARHYYFESAIFIIALVNLGALFEMSARGKTSASIQRLLELRPKTARVIKNGNEVEVPFEQIKIGDLIKIKPGKKIPVDGVIVEGESYIDQSMLTGEAMPVHKKIGEEVIGGTINKSGSFVFKTTKVGNDTVLAQIINVVQQAQNTKPAIARLADEISAIFVPAVIGFAIFTALIWWAVGPEPKSIYMLVTAMSVLVIACPCALGLAVPISVMVGIGKAAEYGVLIRNGEALQQAGSLTTVVLDKTGTITQGQPQLTTIKSLQSDWDEEKILSVAAGIESHSEHPLAQAMIAAAKERNYEIKSIKQFTAEAGYGVVAETGKQKILLGNQKLLEKYQVPLTNLEREEEFAKKGQTPIFMATEKKVIAILAISDPIKTDSAEAIARLKDLGLKVAMVTGDHQQTAQAIAQIGHVDQVFANVLPQDKARIIADLQSQGEKVGMVGDGINDAPALTQANVGFAIGAGTDVAIESADVTLLTSSLQSVADAIIVSRATVRNMKQNLFGAFIYNALAIPIAAGIIYPFTKILLNPVLAGGVMALSSLTVVSNANRLHFFKTRKTAEK